MDDQMSTRTAQALALFALAITLTGCTQSQLRRTTIQQSRTISDIHLQQVMDNLAMFAYDPNSLPHFLIPNASATAVTDRAGVDDSISFNSSGFLGSTLGVDGSRTVNGNFTLFPVNDPHKLALMRCAYQTALWNCGLAAVSSSCPSCEERFKQFYRGPHAHDGQRCLDQHSHCWLGVGCKKDVPDCCPCQYVGEYCGVYVWVASPTGRDELVKLALAILEFAYYDAPVEQTRTVVRTVQRDANGNVTGITEQTSFAEPIKGQYRSQTRSPESVPGGALFFRQNIDALAPPGLR